MKRITTKANEPVILHLPLFGLVLLLRFNANLLDIVNRLTVEANVSKNQLINVALYEESRLSTCNDYLNRSLGLQPGSTINTIATFKLNADDMIVNTLKQHKNKSKKDYALMLLTNDPADVFIKRFRDYKKRLKND